MAQKTVTYLICDVADCTEEAELGAGGVTTVEVLGRQIDLCARHEATLLNPLRHIVREAGRPVVRSVPGKRALRAIG